MVQITSKYILCQPYYKKKINGVRVPQFQLAFICDTTSTSHKNLVKLCREVYCMWWVNKYLELQEWGDCIKPNKKNPIYYYVSPKNNPQGCKEHFIYFIYFSLVEGVTIIDWLENMKLYVSDIEESYEDTIIIVNLVNKL